jgi:DnaJ-class molecular chaperone
VWEGSQRAMTQVKCNCCDGNGVNEVVNDQEDQLELKCCKICNGTGYAKINENDYKEIIERQQQLIQKIAAHNRRLAYRYLHLKYAKGLL